MRDVEGSIRETSLKCCTQQRPGFDVDVFGDVASALVLGNSEAGASEHGFVVPPRFVRSFTGFNKSPK